MQTLDKDFLWAIIVGTMTMLVLASGLIAAIVTSQRRFIKAQRLQMEELSAREQKFRNLFENSLVGMVRLSLHDWTVIEANEAFRVMFANVSPVIHQNFLANFPAAEQSALKEKLYEKGFVEYFETHLRCNDGSYLWISFSGKVYFKDGYVEGVVNNITSRVNAEERNREQAALLEKAHDAIVVLDLENRVQFWNQGAERLYLWSTREAVGRTITDLIYDRPEKDAFGKRRQELLATGEWSGDVNQIRKDGGQVIASSRWTLVKNSDGTPKSILEIHADITDKRLLEAKFLRVQRLESLGILAGGIAHDLNNILAPILLSIQFLKKKWTDPASQKHLVTLEKSAHRGADLIKQLLTFARGIEGERVGIRPESLVQEVLTIASQTFPKSIELHSAIANEPWTVIGDVTQLHQVLINLSINARDAMPHGGRLSITVDNVVIDEPFVKKNPEAKPGVYVLMQVTDTGSGIPTSELDKIFEQFYTTKTLGKGTGLGLSTALGIVRSHSGFILVESRTGTGTTFKVYLPAQLYYPPEVGETGHIEYTRSSGETILVVDDEEPVRETTKVILENHGYQVITAIDGSEAIDVYSRNRELIKAVLTDMMMPRLDGAEMIEALLAIDPGVAIIAMSGVPGSSDRKIVGGKGIQAVLQKPYTEDKLLKVLHETLHHGDIPA